jgi:type I restriction enzyme S subunit
MSTPSNLDTQLESRYGHNPTALDYMQRMIFKHIDELKLGDKKLIKDLCGNDDHKYWESLSEILLAHSLLSTEATLTRKKKGPDFLFQKNNINIWIEVTCPRPMGLPPEWTNIELRPNNIAYSSPLDQILLRWTNSIDAKSKKLVEYLEKKIVLPTAAYVIAINGRRLRDRIPELIGVSGYPYAAEAVFPIGPRFVSIDRHTHNISDSGHIHRTEVKKPGSSAVPTEFFLSKDSEYVSAIWATDICEVTVTENITPQMAVIHNPFAKNPIPLGLLPAQKEYIAINQGDSFLIETIAGSLSPRSES